MKKSAANQCVKNLPVHRRDAENAEFSQSFTFSSALPLRTQRLCGEKRIRRSSRGKIASILIFAFLFSANAFAQRATGSISGRVVSEDGQPIPHAKVNIVGVGGGVKKAMSGRMAIVTDEHGNFAADKLDPISYSITATAPGYVVLPNDKSRRTIRHKHGEILPCR
jgi:hypothetical protein